MNSDMHFGKKGYAEKRTCRVCGSKQLAPILTLGSMPPANNFLKLSELKKKERRFPLAVQFCKHCSLLSLRHVVDPNILFRNYQYLTGASRPLAEHFIAEADMIVKKYIRNKKDLVVEFGSNDGVLLGALKHHCRVLGVDPAKNVARRARAQGIETLNSFFTKDTALRIRKKYGRANVIIANNVFAHIDELDDVMHGINTLLRDDGVFISESHWVGNLLGKGGFDQIYHEHLCYFSLHALEVLAKRFNLYITDVEVVPIHGESIRVFMSKQNKKSSRVKRLLAREKRLGLDTLQTFKSFAKKVTRNRNVLRKLLLNIKRNKKTIAGYGAPAKGNTLLNYFNIGPEILDFITDTTPLKQERYTPGTHIPVVSPEVLKKRPPDFLLLLSWNYANAILKKEAALRAAGVKFIIPVPYPRIL